MASIDDSIEINVPVRTAYDQWTQFESFPQFMENIREVKQVDDAHVHWRAEIMGKDLEWDAEITRQVPDEIIEWRSVNGPANGGYVRFTPTDSNRTKVDVHIDYDAQTATEKLGSSMGVPQNQVHEQLEHFKEFLEKRGTETGAWRGSI